MKRVLCIAAGAVLLVGSFSSPASAGLITFGSRAAFDLAAPGLPVEGFEGVPDLGITGFDGPLSSAGAGPFPLGAILDGITIDRFIQGGGAQGLVGVGASAGFGNPDNVVLANYFVDAFDLMFANANAVGFDAWTYLGSGVVDVHVYGAGDVLLGSFLGIGASGGFFGVINDAGLITRIRINDLGNGAEGGDNIAFGLAGDPIPEPGTFLLLGTGLAAVAVRRRLKKRA